MIAPMAEAAARRRRDPRRVALVSVAAALVLLAIKLGAGLASGSLGLLSEAVHSGTDLVAALLTFFTLRVALRPPDAAHPWGHGKAEHLAALAEGALLVILSVLIGVLAVGRLAGDGGQVDASWIALGAAGLVLIIDLGRVVALTRAARAHSSSALAASAVHFAADLAGTLAVLAGLLLVRAGYPGADAVAALFVAALAALAAVRLMRVNVDVLMDRVPPAAQDAARRAVERLRPRVDLRSLRMRRAGRHHFVEVTVAVAPGAAVGQGHAAATAVEEAVERAVPGSEVMVHVEPRAGEDAPVRERVLAAALEVDEVREIHNVSLLDVGGRTEATLHLKLPGDLDLGAAHDLASRVEHAVMAGVPGVAAVHTHLEPLPGAPDGRTLVVDGVVVAARVAAIGREVGGAPPRRVRLLSTPEGIVAFITLVLESGTPLETAHRRAGEVRHRVREEGLVADAFVHTEPA
jgi:cation diffusion facilitator family transporter